MQYLGGKTRIAKQIAAEINRIRRPGQLVWDAFCGGLSVSVALRGAGPVLSTDACAPLIALYQAVQRGWSPPDFVSQETWLAARSLPDSDPMKAFCGFGCSFGGKWFGGYMKHDPGKAEHVYTKRRLLKDCRSVDRFGHVDFMREPARRIDAVIYLDPPYKGAEAYAGMPDFDSHLFWLRAEAWSRFCPVFVSEYQSDWPEVWRQTVTCNVSGGTGSPRVERLFYRGP
jgi:DNA adenine methylase